jgi:hypothetical protein
VSPFLTFGWFDARDVSMQLGYFVSRFEWQERFRAQVAPLRWINYHKGLWWVYESTSYFHPASNLLAPRVVTAAEVGRADLAAMDWMMSYQADSTLGGVRAAQEAVIVAEAKARSAAGRRSWGALVTPPTTLNGLQL